MRKNDDKVELDLNVPEQARKFLMEALPEALPSRATHVVLKDGRELAFEDMNDSEVVQYAWELLPIFQSAFPNNVDVHTLQ